MTTKRSTSQSTISAFDHAHALLYFDFLTRKMTELDFDVFIPNVDLSLSFKMLEVSSQSNACNSRYSQNIKRCQSCKTSFLYTKLHFISCTSYSLFITFFFFRREAPKLVSFYHFKLSSIIQLSSQIMSFNDWIIKPIKTWNFDR